MELDARWLVSLSRVEVKPFAYSSSRHSIEYRKWTRSCPGSEMCL
jgi:hypothetical protein